MKHPFIRKKTTIWVLVLVLAYVIGYSIAQRVYPTAATPAAAEANWGLSFQEEGKPPVGNATPEYLKDFNAYYVNETDDKVIYLTFDEGYENGNTDAILDALKKHQAPATFFLVGNYIETSPDLVKRMVAEGHTVGNHTCHHPNMSQISTKEAFEKELKDLEALYEKTTGQPMTKFYRPPQGKYNETNLQMAKDMGYRTFFWSLAYVDWYENDQPTREEAFEKLLGRIHPGAIVLLHSTSKTNGEILDELLTKWEEMGYHFDSLSNLPQEAGAGLVRLQSLRFLDFYLPMRYTQINLRSRTAAHTETSNSHRTVQLTRSRPGSRRTT